MNAFFPSSKTIIGRIMFYYLECEMIKRNMARELKKKKREEGKKNTCMHIYCFPSFKIAVFFSYFSENTFGVSYKCLIY